jgi:DNA-directed RNA polymerase subunit RPC12/RpoP
MTMTAGNRQRTAHDTDSCDRQAILEMRCSKCHREYRIRRSRIPKGASAVHCKECGAKIRFAKPAAAAAHPRRHQSSAPGLKKPRFRLDLMTPEKRRDGRRFKLIHS